MGRDQRIDSLYIKNELETQFFFLIEEMGGLKDSKKINGIEKTVIYIRGRAFYEEDFRNMMKTFNGNKSAVAKELGISRTSLWRYLKDLGIYDF